MSPNASSYRKNVSDKIFKNGLNETCGRKYLKNLCMWTDLITSAKFYVKFTWSILK